MAPDVNRCGAHDQLVGTIARVEGQLDSIKTTLGEHSTAVEQLHSRINSIHACLNSFKLDTVKAVSRNNVKLIAIASPLSGALVALITHFIK